MSSSIKIRAKSVSGTATIKALISHPMETGLRKDKKTGKAIPAHHITEVHADLNDKRVFTAEWSGAVSKNPYLSFKVKGSKGDKLKLSWVDNTENGDSIETTIK